MIRRWWAPAAAAAATLFAVVVLQFDLAGLGGFLESFERATRDARRAGEPRLPASREIVIVDLDEASYQAVGARAGHGEALDRLNAAVLNRIFLGRPKAVYSTLPGIVSPALLEHRDEGWLSERDRHSSMFSNMGNFGLMSLKRFVCNTSLTVPPGQDDDTKALTLSAGDLAYFTLRHDPKEWPAKIFPPLTAPYLPPRVILDASAGMGNSLIVPDPDGLVRGLPVAGRLRAPEILVPGGFLEVIRAADHERVDPPRLEGRFVRIAEDPPIPVDARGRMPIRFAGPAGTFQTLPLSRVYSGEIPPSHFLDRIVLIGSSSMTLGNYAETTEGAMSDVEVIANAVNTIRQGAWPRLTDRRHEVIVPLAVGLAIAAAAFLPGLAFFLGAALILAAALPVASYQVAAIRALMLPVVPLLAVAVAATAAATLVKLADAVLRRTAMAATFKRFVSRNVAERLIAEPTLLSISGSRHTVTVLFSDIRGFTSFSEKQQPDMIAAILNEYFAEMIEIVFKHGGTLNKLMGDAIMAFWNDPVPQADHAARAVATALEMRARMRVLKERWAARGQVSIDIGIGINTGEVLVGNVGSENYTDYTVIGDQVNVAARLEEIAAPGEILLGETTASAAAAPVEERPPVQVKGRAEAVRVFRVIQ